jgi:hypothetical protein
MLDECLSRLTIDYRRNLKEKRSSMFRNECVVAMLDKLLGRELSRIGARSEFLILSKKKRNTLATFRLDAQGRLRVERWRLNVLNHSIIGYVILKWRCCLLRLPSASVDVMRDAWRNWVGLMELLPNYYFKLYINLHLRVWDRVGLTLRCWRWTISNFSTLCQLKANLSLVWPGAY